MSLVWVEKFEGLARRAGVKGWESVCRKLILVPLVSTGDLYSSHAPFMKSGRVLLCPFPLGASSQENPGYERTRGVYFPGRGTLLLNLIISNQYSQNATVIAILEYSVGTKPSNSKTFSDKI